MSVGAIEGDGEPVNDPHSTLFVSQTDGRNAHGREGDALS